jgi:hypothetical protein
VASTIDCRLQTDSIKVIDNNHVIWIKVLEYTLNQITISNLISGLLNRFGD